MVLGKKTLINEDRLKLVSNSTGNWEIYRAVDNETNEAYIVRFPKRSYGTAIDDYINNYQLIKKLGLPTLNTVERIDCKGKTGIITEDLNYLKDTIYVSHNSVYSKSRKVLDALNPSANESHEKIRPEYEEFRYTNRLEKITNFEEFVSNIKKDLLVAATQGVLIDFDSYFFGSQKLAKASAIDYKLVDLDNILVDEEKNAAVLYENNLSEFDRAIRGFINHFVEDTMQFLYLEYLTS